MKTDHGGRCRPLSLSILDQAPLWLVAPGVNSIWLVNTDDGSRADSLSLARATCSGWFLHRVWSLTPFPPASRIDDQSLPRGEGCSSLHLEGWELRPPSNYQLSAGRLSRCCPSPVFTVLGQTNRSPPLVFCVNEPLACVCLQQLLPEAVRLSENFNDVRPMSQSV